MTTPDPAADLVAALTALNDPPKDGKVSSGQRQYRYLELPDLLEEVRAKFGAYGWAILQQVTAEPGTVTVTNLWIHRTGAKITHPPFSMPAGRTPHEIGSAITYARRYSLAAATALSGSNDDDATTLQAARSRADGPRTVRVAVTPTDAEPAAHEAATATTDRLTAGITPAQMGKLGALIGEWEKTENTHLDRDQRRALIARMAGVEQLASAKDLTRAEAHAAIDQLQDALRAGSA